MNDLASNVAPPSDLDAEGAVLCALLVDPTARVDLEPHHFYADANRWIYEAIVALRATGSADAVSVAAWLRDCNRLRQVGGTPYIAELSNASPGLSNVAQHARIVLEKWRARQLIAAAQRTVADGYNGADSTTLYSRLSVELERLVLHERGWQCSDIFAPLAPVPWLCEGLKIVAGAPVLFAGYGYSGKTVSLQALAMAVATGSPIWGHHAARRGSVAHLDYEQGGRLTRTRYQRLALAMGAWDPLPVDLYALPPSTLDTPAGLTELRRVCDGRQLCIVDSLRAAFPSGDENSSEIRGLLQPLIRISEESGCVIALVHHARKPNKDSVGGSKMSIRGSGAIYDACGGVFVLDGTAKGKPVVTHEKDRETGTEVDAFALSIADVPVPVEELSEEVASATNIDGIASTDGLLRSGLRVSVATIDQPVTALSLMKRRLLENLRERGPVKTKGELVLRTGAKRTLAWEAIADLIADGDVEASRAGLRATD